MSKPIEGEPAFPNGPSGGMIQYEDGHVAHEYPGSPGMTLRQWYIGQAMAGILANPASVRSFKQIAVDSVRQADVLMEVLYPQPTKENE